jgi:radical SAM protein with 4Fe4S-binding SPASM domain
MFELNTELFYFNPLCDIIVNESKTQVAVLHPLNKKWIKISFDAYFILELLSTTNILALRKKNELASDSETELKDLIKYLLENKYLVIEKDFEELRKTDIIDSYKHMMKSNLYSISKRVYLSLTSACNLKCIHCYNTVRKPDISSNNSDVMIYDVLERLKGDNIQEIILTGGEPFLRSDIFDIIKKTSEITKNITINTNGLLINSEIVQSLKEYDFLTIAVSLDGLTKQTHERVRGENTYEDTLSIIKTLVKNGIKAHVIATITKINYKELVNFNEFIENLGVGGNLSFYTPVGTGKKAIERLLMDNESLQDYRKLLLKKHENCNIESDTSKNLTLPIKFNCSAGIGVIGIEHTGRVVPCHLFLGKDISLGNILDESLLDMQNRWIENGLISVDQNVECGKCSIRHFCGNGCFANAYYNSTANAKDPNCSIHQFGLEDKIWRCNN